MEPHENDDSTKTSQGMPQKKPMNLPSPWSTSTRLNSVGPYYQPSSLANQVGQGAPLTSPAQEGYKIYTDYFKSVNQSEGVPLTSPAQEAYKIYTDYFKSVNQSEGVPLAPPSEETPKPFTEYMESVNQSEENLQCVKNNESQIYEIMSPFNKHTWERESWSGAKENMGSSSAPIGHDEVNNAGGFEETLFKDLSYQSNMMLGNENTNIALQHLVVDPTELDQNLGQDLNAASTNLQTEMQVSDEEEKQRKRKSISGLPKIPKDPKQQEYVKQRKKVNYLTAKNKILKEKLERLSEECLDLSIENESLERQKELTEKYGVEVTEILGSFDSSILDSFASDGNGRADADGDGGADADVDADGGGADGDGDADGDGVADGDES